MCMKKIIGKGVFRVVPIGECLCPMIKKFRDLDHPEPPKYPLKECQNIKTEMKESEHFIYLRFCVCNDPSGRCGKLPPLAPLPSENFNNEDEENYG